jgi:uncharacterized membrane protein YkvA (DUF1232 family)
VDRRARSARALVRKAIAGGVAAYALSPIDLIPDVIPVLGYLDDLLIVPAGIWLVIRMIDPELMAEFRARASDSDRPRSYAAAIAIVLLWLGTIAIAVSMIVRAGWL